MGITVFYRGSLADLDRVADLEDRVFDLALQVGGNAQIWRSVSDCDRRRVVRGVIVDLYPGQEPTSLLVSPEGWLINLFEVEAAERGGLDESPWCFVKTQFGPVEGHVALIELLACLKKEFIPNLEVHDEGGYLDHRDVDALQQTFARAHAAIDGISEGLRRHGLSREAAEDPEIVASRIVRVARLVHRTLSRPSEHPPAGFGDDSGFVDGSDANEARSDALYRENRRKQERLNRAMEERMAGGDADGDPFEAALRDEGILDLPGEPSEAESDAGWDLDDSTAEEDQPWRESLPEAIRQSETTCGAEEDAGEDRSAAERHPLQQQAMDLMLRLRQLAGASHTSHVSVLRYSAGEVLGGLAQAFGTRGSQPDIDLSLVQLQRALRATAFALGSLLPLHVDGALDAQSLAELRQRIEAIEAGILDQLRRLRDSRQDD